MISDLTGTRHNVIPGKLKAVILDAKTTVAFAGLPDQAIDAIKVAKCLLLKGASVAHVEQSLAKATNEYRGRLDFILVTHHDGVALKRIWEGRISGHLNQTCIGQRDLLPALLALEADVPQGMVPHQFEKEVPFSSAFRKLFNGIHISGGAGGFGISTVCSPFGHCYSGFGGVVSWDTVVISADGSGGVSEQQLEDRRSGMTQWGYNISEPKLRGVGVVGAIVPDAGVGFIYSPFQQDDPIQFRLSVQTEQFQHHTILEAFQQRVDEIARALGGGIEVEIPLPISRPPTDIELRQVRIYASRAPRPTEITLLADAIWIDCGKRPAHRGVRVDFRALSPNPVWVLTTTIDRLNRAIKGPMN
jgi:hypothetical protein